MSRRLQRPELEFGSDSFLDVVCNIVGILIILIVVVAVKVQRQPIDGTPVAVAPPNEAAIPTDHGPLITSLSTELNDLQNRRSGLNSETACLQRAEHDIASEIESLLVQRQLNADQRTATAAVVTELNNETRELLANRARLSARTTALTELISESDRESLKVGELLTSATRAKDDTNKDARDSVVETQRLEEVLQQTQQAAAPKDRMEHRLSPVSRTVVDEKIFFRIEGGRISAVPIMELMERLKAQVKQKSAAILRFSQFEGVVGPVGGYRMKYVVEKSGETSLDELIWGDGRISISVRQWTVIPEDGPHGESVAEAMQPGSRFRQIVETAAPDETITMWIYPDSFDSFGSLRDIAHGLQLRVAARPMPAGTPIVGSPNGSKSSAQ